MGSGGMAMAVAMVATLLAVAVMAPTAAAQTNPPACAQRLIPCAQYLGSKSKPPDTCCSQVEEAVKNELPCLCSLLNNTQLLQSFNINVTQALELPKNCGLTTEQSPCGTKTTTPGTGGAGGPTAPPATPGGNDGNGAAAVARVGASGLVCVLAIWWSVVA